MSLNDEIGDFGGLVGLLLALVTLLTANRATALNDLRDATDISAGDRRREVTFNVLLATITILVFFAGLPLAVRAAHPIHPLAHGEPLRLVFVLAWILLIPLVGWQLRLAKAAYDLTLSG